MNRRINNYTELEINHNKLKNLLWNYCNQKITYKNTQDYQDKKKLSKIISELKQLVDINQYKTLTKRIHKFIKHQENVNQYVPYWDELWHEFEYVTCIQLADYVYNTIDLRSKRDEEYEAEQKLFEIQNNIILQRLEDEYQAKLIKQDTKQNISPELRLYSI